MFSHEKTIHDFERAEKFFENIISYTTGPYTLNEMIKSKIDMINIVDVRDYDDYSKGHIPYAMHIPVNEIEENTKMLIKDKITVIYTYSSSCPRAYKTALHLVKKHFPCCVLRGGFKEWKKFDFDIVKTDSVSDYEKPER